MPASFSSRLVIACVFAGYGAAAGLWSGSVPAVMARAGIDEIALGLGISAFTIAYVSAMYLGGTLAHLLSNRGILLAGLPLSAAAAACLLLAAGPVAFFAALTAMGVCLGLVDVAMNAEASHAEHVIGRPVLVRFHAVVALSCALFALAGSWMSIDSGVSAVALVAVLALGLTWLAAWRWLPAHRIVPDQLVEPVRAASRAALAVLGLACGLIVACETAAMMWSALLLTELAPGLAALSGAGVAFFGGCMALGRFGGDSLRSRFGDAATLIGSLLIAMIGYTIVAYSGHFALSLLGFAVTGLGTACLVPILFALAAAQTPRNRGAGIGIASLIAGLPRMLAPWLFGWTAESVSMSAAFGLCAAALAAAMVLVLLLRGLASGPSRRQGARRVAVPKAAVAGSTERQVEPTVPGVPAPAPSSPCASD